MKPKQLRASEAKSLGLAIKSHLNRQMKKRGCRVFSKRGELNGSGYWEKHY